MKNKKHSKKGFTLIEILVVIGIIAILAGVVLVAVSPGRQFKQARDSQRVAHVNTILNAIGQNISDHQGQFFCNSGVDISGIWLDMKSDVVNNSVRMADCLVPEYLPKMPADPIRGHYTDEDDYDLGYQVRIDGQDRVSVKAIGEMTPEIIVTR